jgi:DNA-binding transcriptional LysR family regulator
MIAMNTIDLRRIDLNLLVTLETLLTEHSVTRSAQRLHLSQPAVSVQLRKLREIFSDPLLTTSPAGMLPTARAQALLPMVRSALAEVGRVFGQDQHFEPGRAQMTWQIAAADYAQYAIVLPLLKTLRRTALGVRVSIRHASHGKMFRHLDSGTIDLALMALDSVPDHLHREALYQEDYVLIARKRHPALKRKLSLDAFCQLDFILVSPEGGGFHGITDTMLESRKRKRRVMLSTQHFLFSPEVVANTDLVAVVPSRLVQHRTDLQLVSPPLPIPGYEMGMVWHERSHADPAHRWLREQVKKASA